MNPYSLPSLISTILLIALGFILLLHNRKEKINLLFSALMFVSALSNMSAFFFHLSTNEETALFWTKIPYIFVIPSGSVGLYYVLVLTGLDKRRGEKLFAIPVKLHFWTTLFLNIFLVGLLILTDSIVSGVEFNSVTGFEHTYGELFVITIIYFVYVGIVDIFLMVRSYRRSIHWLEKLRLQYNLTGFLIIFVGGVILALYLPLKGIPSHSFTFVPFTLAAFIFYYALLRYHIGQIQELNENLEQKVEERTKELSHTLDELKSTQGHLVQSEKMAALGKLTAGIAHEVNNPIGAVTSAADVANRCVIKIKETIENSKTVEEMINNDSINKSFKVLGDSNKIIIAASDRMAHLVNSLKNFTRIDEAEYQKANIHDGIESTLTLMQHEIKEGIKVEKQLSDLPLIYCNPSELNQVFMTLLTNAVQALGNKGTVTIKTSMEGENIIIIVSDTGRGMSPEHIENMFDLSFTVKGARIGIGMGLSSAYNIIQKHEGEIKVESEVGEGSTFTIILPRDLKKTLETH